MRALPSIAPNLRTVLTAALGAALAAPALAGIGDSPLPPFPEKGKHVFSIPGVLKNGTFETVVRCTVVKAKGGSASISVEYFDSSGSRLGQGTLAVGVGGTIGIATGSVATESISYMNSLPAFAGSARVISNAGGLICDAYVIEKSGTPPVSMRSLPVIMKLKQRGD